MLKTIFLASLLTLLSIQSGWAGNDKVAFGQSRPPYVMQDTQSGISIELFKRIYANLSRSFHPIYLSNNRLELSISKGIVEAAVEVKNTNPDLFYSDEFVSYQNFIITRKSDAKAISAFSDLAGMTVCTWQQADQHLGAVFQQAMASFEYREFPNQDAQVRAFLGGRCDALIVDKKIFSHWTETFRKDKTFANNIVSLEFSHRPVPGQSINPFYVGFRDKILRDQFNTELRALKKSGKYDEIVNWKDWSTPPS